MKSGAVRAVLQPGEGIMLACAAPGLVAGAALALVLGFERLGVVPPPNPLALGLAFLAMGSPLLVILGALTLPLGALNLPQVSGRRSHKWTILALGAIAWAAAAYWLSVPGMIELP